MNPAVGTANSLSGFADTAEVGERDEDHEPDRELHPVRSDRRGGSQTPRHRGDDHVIRVIQ
jgi:hypothetical protein